MMHTLPPSINSKQTYAIVGFGREGKSTYQFLRSRFPSAEISVYDEKEIILSDDPHAHCIVGRLEEQVINQAVVFKTPGIPASRFKLDEKSVLTSQADIFMQMFSRQVIGITGTKGKSTTAHVIHSLLQLYGKDVVFVGNIGKPCLDVVENITTDTVIVFELSAFQCESLHVAPHIAVFTSFYQDHLDYYPDISSYLQAKAHMFTLQRDDDIAILRIDNPTILGVVNTMPAMAYGYSRGMMADTAIYLEHEAVYFPHHSPDILTSTESWKIRGTTNQMNVLPAILVAHLLGCSLDAVGEYVQSIEPLPGRLEKVATIQGITFYDDALATIPEATIAAIETLQGDLATLIVGGFDRGQDFEKLAKVISASSIATLIVLPTTGKTIASKVLQYRDTMKVVEAHSMEEVVSLALTHTKSGKIVLLSTASPSFGMFVNYEDRSRQYKKCLELNA